MKLVNKMANPKFIDEEALSLGHVKGFLSEVEKRDTELNFLSNKCKEYLDAFVILSEKKRSDLHKKLADLDLTRLKDEHISKITDFLPKDANDLKVVLQAYPLSLPKKDMDAIIGVVKQFL
jgi:DNA-directed RNA polymerase subunit F